MLRDPKCSLCPILCKSADTVCLPGSGPEDAEIMIIGEAPGSREDALGEPFVGPAGSFLKGKLFRGAGIDEDEVRYTNAVRCRPPNNRTPTIREIGKCHQYLDAEVRMVKPKVAVLVGNVSLASALYFYGKDEDKESKVSGIMKWRGKQIWHQYWNCWVVPILHPSFLQRQYNSGSRYFLDKTIEDLELANYLVGVDPPVSELTIARGDTVERAVELLDDLSMRREEVLAFDVETSTESRICDAKVLCASYAVDKHMGVVIPEPILRKPEVMRLHNNLVRRAPKLLMHNGDFDYRVCHYNNIHLPSRYWDTMMAANMVDENFYVGLKSLSWIYTPFGGYERGLDDYKLENKIKNYADIPFEKLYRYSGCDSVALVWLYEALRERMVEDGCIALFEKVSMPVRRVLTNAEIKGIRVDVEQAEKLKKACEVAKDRLEEKIYSEVGEFNINSVQQLGSVLYKKLKYKPFKKLKTGYSTDKGSIEYCLLQNIERGGGSEVPRILLQRSFLKTMLGTHIKQALSFLWDDGRVHTNYNLTGTVTGRPSGSRPNLNNVPNDGLVRSLYIASEGCQLIEADLKMAELAYLAAESGEEVFLEAMRNGTDMHMETAKRVLGIANPTKEQRRVAKTINFGVIYGMSPMQLALRLSIPESEAEEYIERYFAALPMVTAYLERCKSDAREYGYVESLFRRRRRLPEAMSDTVYDVARAERQAMNAPIQGGASDVAYVGMIRTDKELRKRGLDTEIIHSVYDCAILDAPIPEVSEAMDVVRTCFETPISVVPVQMRVDVEAHRRWGEGHESELQGILESVGVKV